MRRPYKNKGEPLGEAVMSFDEIARVLGITRRGVGQLYTRGMRKLRRHPKQFEAIRRLAISKERAEY